MTLEKKILVLKEHNHFYYGGCHQNYLRESYFWEEKFVAPKTFLFNKNEDSVCFKVQHSLEEDKIGFLQLETSYYIGLQYITEWNIPLLVEPKLNNRNSKLNFFKMLSEALQEPENFNHLDGLMEVDFDAEWIEVPPQHEVELTPFLIVQFLMAVKQIIKKGLKKNYYSRTENLRSRIKGKILVGQQLKQNIFKYRLTNTVCSYQEFGFDTSENQFLKYVLQIIYSYTENFESTLETQILELVNYNLAAFQQVSDQKFKSFYKRENNPFYKVYNNAFELGNQILKLQSHSYGKTLYENKKYPPHWIDMSKLFELYVFKKLRERFSAEGEVQYHTKLHYQELDFIINSVNFKAVIDAKYKPRYKNGSPTKEDARQISGYSRLSRVYDKLKIDDDQIIPVYFIYPKGIGEISNDEDNQAEEIDSGDSQTSILNSGTPVTKVKAYRKMYMQEVSLEVLHLKVK